jgi:hypothetical protein
MSAPAMERPVVWWIFPTVPAVAAAIAFAWTLNAELMRVYGMTSPAWDLAYNQQIVWNVSVGQGFYSSFERAGLLGIHLELILVVLAAIEKLWASPVVLIIFSAAGLAATAPAAYLFLRALLPADRAESPWLAVALSAPIPFWVATQEAAIDSFQPEILALPLALLAAWAGMRGHRVVMWILCVLVLICKEDQAFTVALIGTLMGAYGAPEVRKHWGFIVYLAGAWFFFSRVLVQRVAVLSGQTPRDGLLLLFPLIVAGGIGARKLLEIRSLRPATALLLILPAMLLAWGIGRIPPALGAEPGVYSRPNAVAELRRATEMIPADAPVNADPGLAVWLANRHTINDFPDRLDARCYAVIDRQAYLSGPTKPKVRQAAIDSLPDSGRSVLFDDGRFQVWGPAGGD